MLIYGLKNCDTCRKAMRAFPEATLVDVRADGVPEETLQKAWQTFGNTLLNTRSTTWRGLSEEERAQEPLALLRAHPTLMKRPLTDVDGVLFLSWNSGIERDIKAKL